MRTWSSLVIGMLTVGILAPVVASRAGEGDKPKHTNKEVMVLAHKGPQALFNKLMQGKATDEDKKDLADLYADLAKNTPKKGSADSWKEKTEAVAAAAKDVAAGKPDSAIALKKANNCAACHKMHK